jgi:outer membrane protein OmpA-like peptidoglycan-associated protein
MWVRRIWKGRLAVALAALLVAGLASGCSSKTATGAGVGAAVGGVTGAVIGHQSGHKTEGAVIGAAAGAAVGGVIGHRMDKQAEELAKIAETKRTEQGVIVTLSSNKIHFDTNSSVVKEDSRQTLVQLANVLKQYPEDIILVAGHTDSDGAADYNMRLSEARAQAVADILIANGVAIESVQSHGYGETQPVAENTTTDGKAQNRRVELSITVDESKVPKEGG